MKAVVVGAKGGIGRVIVEHLHDHEVVSLDVDECDLRDDASVANALRASAASTSS